MATEVTRRPVSFCTSPFTSVARSGLPALCLAGSMSCRDKAKPKADQPTSSAVPLTSESVARRPSAPPIVSLTPEVFAPENKHPTAIYAVEGALMVVEGVRVGRINGESIEWIGSVPKQGEFGDNIIGSVRDAGPTPSGR